MISYWWGRTRELLIRMKISINDMKYFLELQIYKAPVCLSSQIHVATKSHDHSQLPPGCKNTKNDPKGIAIVLFSRQRLLRKLHHMHAEVHHCVKHRLLRYVLHFLRGWCIPTIYTQYLMLHRYMICDIWVTYRNGVSRLDPYSLSLHTSKD